MTCPHPLYTPVLDLLRKVGEDIVLAHFQSLGDGQIREKTPGELVTTADTESEQALREALLKLLPGALAVGEEAAEADPTLIDDIGAAACWIIDPIDGTANFAAGRAPFGILIALAEHGDVKAGWLYDPLAQRICHAHSGKGAFVNGKAVQARTTEEGRPVAAVSTLFVDAGEREGLIARAAEHYRLVDIPRCAAEQYPRLVLGENDISIFERTLPWDHAAGVLFLNEAGGFAARPEGKPYKISNLSSGLLAASSRRIWDDARTVLYP